MIFSLRYELTVPKEAYNAMVFGDVFITGKRCLHYLVHFNLLKGDFLLLKLTGEHSHGFLKEAKILEYKEVDSTKYINNYKVWTC